MARVTNPRNKSQCRGERSSAFTLIELLVVIAIISLLAAIPPTGKNAAAIMD